MRVDYCFPRPLLRFPAKLQSDLLYLFYLGELAVVPRNTKELFNLFTIPVQIHLVTSGSLFWREGRWGRKKSLSAHEFASLASHSKRQGLFIRLLCVIHCSCHLALSDGILSAAWDVTGYKQKIASASFPSQSPEPHAAPARNPLFPWSPPSRQISKPVWGVGWGGWGAVERWG